MKGILTLILGCILSWAVAQDVTFNFNDCTLSSAGGNIPAATGDFDCQCGVVDNALYLDGNNGAVIFDGAIDSLMEEDFTLSFYFRIESSFEPTDIFSIRSSCNFDSLMALTYNPISDKLLLQLGNDLGSIKTLEASLGKDRCWHRFVLTKSGLAYTFYLDGKLVDTHLSPTTIIFGKNAKASFANSPCLVVNEDRFQGWIDEFTLHTRALSSIELTNNNYRVDQIITPDTTIVKGETVDIVVGPTCATSWEWTPSSTLLDPSDLDAIATPEETTTYFLTLNNSQGCQTMDSVTLFVITEDALDCNKLLLPNAFTPNNDQLNDEYGISNLFLVEDIDHFKIYNRSGGLVWESMEKNATWDGTFDGTPVNPGMFMYQIQYTCQGKTYNKVDNFSVLR